jgi:hypothetical protein
VKDDFIAKYDLLLIPHITRGNAYVVLPLLVFDLN